MRVYFEKPRTTVGWKGLINDPHLDDSFKLEEGLHIGRKLLLDILELGLPTSTEAQPEKQTVLSVTVKADGTIFVNEAPVPLDTLVPLLRQHAAADDQTG